jgi:DNA-binding CsgD family transcriptional regulator
METINKPEMENTNKPEHTDMDALALSCKRLKKKGLSLVEIACRHDISLIQVIALLNRKNINGKH